MLSKLKEKYRSLKPEQQQRATIGMIVGGIVVFASLTYALAPASKPNKPVNLTTGPGKEVLNLDNKILEKTVTAQNAHTTQEVDDLKKQIAQMQGSATATTGSPGTPAGTLPAAGQPIPTGTPMGTSQGQNAAGIQQLDKIISQRTQAAATPRQQASAMPSLPAPAPAQQHKMQSASLPPIPAPANSGSMRFSPPPPPSSGRDYYDRGPQTTLQPTRQQIVVDIGEAVNDMKGGAKSADEEGKKKDSKRAVYLPPSFMEATLLSGLNAPTSDAGRNNPVPVIIRIAAPAVLPNEVRANLKGCFVIGEAVGSLSDERAHTRLVSISCLSRKGQAVIDQEINGFVQDADGGIGLTGRVVSKMGAAVARLAAVGVLQGIGNGLSATSTSTVTTPLGQVSALSSNLKDIGMAAAGNGVANAAKGLAKIYEDLTLGSLPVIEVGNGKRITLVVTKGVSLEIKNYKTVPSWH